MIGIKKRIVEIISTLHVYLDITPCPLYEKVECVPDDNLYYITITDDTAQELLDLLIAEYELLSAELIALEEKVQLYVDTHSLSVSISSSQPYA